MEDLNKKDNKALQTEGIILTLIAGTLWGFSGNCAQFLFSKYGVTPLFVTTMRQLFSGIILGIIALFKYRSDTKALFSKGNTVLKLLIFAFFGVLFNQISYLQTISYTNSGTATILQYIGPVLIVAVSCAMNRRLPTFKEVLAVILVLLGTFLIATHGDFTALYITPAGLIWGLLSAVAMVLYTMLPVNLIKEYKSIPVVGFSMLIIGLALSALTRFSGGPNVIDSGFLIMITITIVLGTVIPYTLYLVGVTMAGPVKGSLVASIEPVAATVIMIFWLKEPFYPMDFCGFLCIFVTIFLLAKKESQEP